MTLWLVLLLRRRLVGPVALAVLLCAVGGCGSTGISPAPLQTSIARAFANLYVQQQVTMGNPRPTLASLQSRAHCQKGTRATAQTGPGNDWVCRVTFLVAGPATPVVARYNVNVHTDGCYAADGDGPASVNGSRTITGAHYEQVQNPLWLINGCFPLG